MATSPLAYLQLAPVLLRLKRLGRKTDLPPLEGGVLDEQTALMCRALELAASAPHDQLTPRQNRAAFEKNMGIIKLIGGLFESVHSVAQVSIPGPVGAIACRLYRPGTGSGCPWSSISTAVGS